MKRMGQWVPKGLAGLLALAAGVVQAGVPGGGIVGYAPGSVAVPTLSEWTLIGLGLLLMVVAYRVLRTRANGRLLANLLVLGGAAAAGLGGHSLVGSAKAISFTQVEMPSAAGGAVSVPYVNETIEVVNSTPIAQTITSIAPTGFALEGDPGFTPRCTVGLQVPASSSCFVRFDILLEAR
ncbi:MAG: midcut-by-XrtH protein [Burkholderiaceae bacterium]